MNTATATPVTKVAVPTMVRAHALPVDRRAVLARKAREEREAQRQAIHDSFKATLRFAAQLKREGRVDEAKEWRADAYATVEAAGFRVVCNDGSFEVR